ncbi:MAG: YXWGXW repeat-containing protein [Terracidiphilus sp.]
MRLARTARWILLALFFSVVPAASFAGVFISVGIAPPPLPVYVQPVCPEPGMMWTPGYWAYGADGYYWVPGAWVPAPYTGALWTPGYWGWEGGHYLFHDGYWGPHIGYYGGVNYGFGYGGIGFAGGVWRGGFFSYNTAVMHVGIGGAWGSRVYVDHAVVERGFVARDSHVAFAGGPGGIHHDPSPEERVAEHDQHRGPSDVQQHHAEAARMDRTSYAKNNGGHPANGAVSHPLGSSSHTAVTHSSQTTRTTTSTTHTTTTASTAHTNTAGSTHAMTSRPAASASTSHSVAAAPARPTTAPKSGGSGGGSAPKSSPSGHHK